MVRGRPVDTPRDDGTNEEPEFQFKKCRKFKKSSIILFRKLQNVFFYVFISFSRLSYEAHCVKITHFEIIFLQELCINGTVLKYVKNPAPTRFF